MPRFPYEFGFGVEQANVLKTKFSVSQLLLKNIFAGFLHPIFKRFSLFFEKTFPVSIGQTRELKNYCLYDPLQYIVLNFKANLRILFEIVFFYETLTFSLYPFIEAF